jgi:hypothetical protein
MKPIINSSALLFKGDSTVVICWSRPGMQNEENTMETTCLAHHILINRMILYTVLNKLRAMSIFVLKSTFIDACIKQIPWMTRREIHLPEILVMLTHFSITSKVSVLKHSES